MTQAAGSIASKAAVKAANAQQQTAVSTGTGKGALTAYINKMSGEIAKALPSVMTPERFTRIVLSALSTNPKLQECTPASFLGAMMTAAQLGVEPNTPLGQAYLIPRWSGKAQASECQFQLGYKGLIDLAYRSGQVASIGAYTVYANDEFVYELGINPSITHKPAMQDRGAPVAFYAVWRGKDGSYGFEVMSMADVEAHAQKYSDAVKKGWTSPWQTNFEEMAKKTVLKRCLKYAPLKTDFVKAVVMDESVHNSISDDMTLEPIEVEEAISEAVEEVKNE